MKGVTYLEPGYVFAPYVPIVTQPLLLTATFERSPQKGDLIAFHMKGSTVIGLCLRAWIAGGPTGEFLAETGDILEFGKAKSSTIRLEVISKGTCKSTHSVV